MSPALRAATAALSILVASGACTVRERTNPLDPRNEQTAGSIPGFNAVAAEGSVVLAWPPLTQRGVLGYRVHRWRPGLPPEPLGSDDYPSQVGTAEDFAVQIESTYVYRLVAHLASGDSVLSAPDTATPGPRRIAAVAAGSVTLAGFSPDARDLIFGLSSQESYEDLEVDRRRGVLWLPLGSAGRVHRRTMEGIPIGVSLSVDGPSDVSVSPARGIGWVASPARGAVFGFGPDLDDPVARISIFSLGHPRVVEAGAVDLSVWIGTDEGSVYRARSSDGAIQEVWNLGAPIRAIALDEESASAWVAIRRGVANDLYRVTAASPAPVLVRDDFAAVVDLAVDARSRDVWVSERGSPGRGQGRLSRLSASGVTQATLTSIEPFGIDIDPLDGTCWASDLRSNRVLHVGTDGRVLAASAPLAIPFGVRVQIP